MPNRRKELKIEGPNLWYLVGLITSDGNLSKDGRHINITSKDREFLKGVKVLLRLDNKIGIKYNSLRQEAFHIQISNKNFYEFLLSIGLMPNKSLILEKIKVPGEYFPDFLRGLIDGDGCIRRWTHPTNFREQWSLRIYSGSIPFLEWLRQAVEEYLSACGKIYKDTGLRRNCYILKFGKMAARSIAKQCYYPSCFGLLRKKKLAEECVKSYIGWRRSKTLSSCENITDAGMEKLANSRDLKSLVCKDLRVQIPLPAPRISCKFERALSSVG